MIVKSLMVAAVLLASTAAHAALTLNTNGGNGGVSGTQTDFTLSGSDDGSGNPNTTTFTDIAAVRSLVTGTFTYQSFDSDGPGFDPAGYINGTGVQLSNNGGPSVQSGNFSFTVSAGQTFGFYVQSADSVFGRADLTVNDLVISAVPEPMTWGLMIGGFAMTGVAMRRRKAALAA